MWLPVQPPHHALLILSNPLRNPDEISVKLEKEDFKVCVCIGAVFCVF